MHLYCVDLSDPRLHEPARCAEYVALLNPEERARHQRFVFERHRHEFLLTRALARTVVGHHAEAPPAALEFSCGAHGKPALLGAAAQAGLRFNLSNTSGMVLCLVAWGREVGVDVEDTRRKATLDVAERFFSPAEAAALRALPPAEQPGRFFDYWTLKESYIKARGLGLAIPLRSFTFLLGGDAVRLEVDASQGGDGARWHFTQLRPGTTHLIACCVQRHERDPAPPRVMLHPLGWPLLDTARGSLDQ